VDIYRELLLHSDLAEKIPEASTILPMVYAFIACSCSAANQACYFDYRQLTDGRDSIYLDDCVIRQT